MTNKEKMKSRNRQLFKTSHDVLNNQENDEYAKATRPPNKNGGHFNARKTSEKNIGKSRNRKFDMNENGHSEIYDKTTSGQVDQRFENATEEVMEELDTDNLSRENWEAVERAGAEKHIDGQWNRKKKKKEHDYQRKFHRSGRYGTAGDAARSISVAGHGKGYDYYATDSDNDGLTDVSDVEDLNPDVQDIGDIPDGKLKTKNRLKQTETVTKTQGMNDNSKSIRRKINESTSSKIDGNQSKKLEKKAAKKKSKLTFDEKKSKSKFSKKTGKAIIVVGVAGRKVIRKYERIENLSDSDENSALQATDVGSDVLKKVTDKNKQRLNQGLRNRSKKVSLEKFEKKYMKLKHNSKFESTLRSNKMYQNSSGMNKNYQKIKMKKAYNKQVYGTYNKRIQKIIKGSSKKLKDIAMVAFKRIGIYLAIIIFALLLGIIFISSFTGMISNAMSVIAITSYQSGDLEITDAENFYNRFEADLLYAIDNIEVEHSEYDEYRYYVDAVGHNPHEIIAYLTAEFGEFTVSEVQNELSRIFDEQYIYRLTKVVETRYKTVTSTSTDPVTGETTITTKKVSYKWNVLKINLDTNFLEPILLSKLDDEQEELYVTLLETKGNFQNLPSPIKEDWKNSVSSMFGYRLDLFTGEVEFHTGIDIAKPLGTQLVAVIDGIVLDTGYDNSYGKYIILKNDDGQTVLYAHCNNIYLSERTEIYIGEIIGEVGSTGNSTGSHLHLEIRDSNGNRLNPYFYLSDALEF